MLKCKIFSISNSENEFGLWTLIKLEFFGGIIIVNLLSSAVKNIELFVGKEVDVDVNYESTVDIQYVRAKMWTNDADKVVDIKIKIVV